MSDTASPSLFGDGKSPEALRTIGEVAGALKIRQHVLRYWEEQFPTLRPLKRSGGRRYYRTEDVTLLETIDRLVHREGYTLRGARLVLEGKSGEAVAERTSGRTSGGATPPGLASSATGTGSSAELDDSLRAIRARLAAALGD